MAAQTTTRKVAVHQHAQTRTARVQSLTKAIIVTGILLFVPHACWPLTARVLAQLWPGMREA